MRRIIQTAVFGFCLLLPVLALADQIEVLNPAGLRLDGKYVDEFIRSSMDERGLTWPPKYNQFAPGRSELIDIIADANAEVNRLFYLRGWTDGLPVVIPTPERVEWMLQGVDLPGDYLIGSLKPLDGQATIEKIAINAVMAGCRPEHLPFLVAAISALVDPDFDQLGPATTTGYETHMMIISGNAAEQIDLNSGSGTLGRGIHGNSALGRAFHLVIQNVGGSAVGVTDMSNHGNPGEFGMCIVENQAANPWNSIQRDQGYPKRANVVNVAAVGSVVQIITIGMDSGKILDAVAQVLDAAPGVGRSFVDIWLVPPDVAQEFQAAGYSKEDLIQGVRDRLQTPGPERLYVLVAGGAGEKNLILSGFYSMKDLGNVEVELPSTWDWLIEQAQSDY